MGYIGSLKWGGGENSTNGRFRLRILLRTNETIIHNSLYVFDKSGKNLGRSKMQYSYSKEMFTGRAKSIRIIGGLDNQLSHKWSSAVLRFSATSCCLFIHMLPWEG